MPTRHPFEGETLCNNPAVGKAPRAYPNKPLCLAFANAILLLLVLVVDDVLAIPVKFFETIFNVIIQTAYKTTWAEYKRQLNIALLRLKRDYSEGKISKEEMREIESKIFLEMRLANRALAYTKDGASSYSYK